ncbi:hypothetical protein L198_08292 [Cryptococcus wingfieldii CBS 7118]|uniref:Uncharacterized protein n=1 Tax=Cryptococcus wingfieldii CBS 7118 TaxID=1295528 RepID=A0A1E3HBC2_9TREE|nr:hypothetical protein L198_08292 [Cryptococcus wingfieldii CBS 7118]ODN73604.1 hypothetical protein L198_08292 [Cryptococcus wingfieldii CBS 7118]
MSARLARSLGLHPIPLRPLPPRRPIHSSAITRSPTAGGNHQLSNHTQQGQRQHSHKPNNAHANWYREIVPAMLPIFVLSTTLFLSLSLLRTYLSHAYSLAQSETRISELEGELEELRREQRRQRWREKRERERMLPMVVERVLQRVGVVGGEEEEEERVI